MREPKARKPRESADSDDDKPRVRPALVAAGAALLPLFLILFFLKAADVVYVPGYLAPNSPNSAAGIQRGVETS